MGEIREGNFKSPIVRLGPDKGRIRNSNVAHEVVNTIFEGISKPEKPEAKPKDKPEAEPEKFILTSQHIDALNSEDNNIYLIRQAAKTIKAEEKNEFDSLTGLKSKPLAPILVNEYINEIKNNSEDNLALGWMRMDLDLFSWVNDIFEAHHIGDLYLSALGNKVKNLIKPGDVAFRLGGDEFGILFKGKFTKQEFQNIVIRIQQTINKKILGYVFDKLITSDKQVKDQNGILEKESTLFLNEFLLGIINLRDNIEGRRSHFLSHGKGTTTQKEILLDVIDRTDLDHFNNYLDSEKTFNYLSSAEKLERKLIESEAIKVITTILSDIGVSSAGIYLDKERVTDYRHVNSVADKNVSYIKRDKSSSGGKQYPNGVIFV